MKRMMKKGFIVGMMAVYFISASMFSIFAEDTGKKSWPITIQKVKPWTGDLPSLEGMFNPLKEITIENGNFVRDGKFVFLLAEQQFFYPDILRILGIDIAEMRDIGHAVWPYSTLMKVKDQKIDVTYRTPRHVERSLREALMYGIVPQFEFSDSRGFYAMGTIEKHYPDAFMPKQMPHFIGFNETNPLGYKLRRGYWQNIMNATAKYPMFSYEMFNEIPYSNGGKHEQELFRKHLQEKFKTLSRMNQVLDCDYASFSEVHIPNIWKRDIERFFPGISGNLFTEWCVFQSKRSGQMAKIWYDSMKQMLKYYPSHINLQSPWLGGQMGFDPRQKVKGEDIFGAETYSAAFDGDLSPTIVKLELMKGPQYMDVVRAACPDKPIFDYEGRVGKSNSMGVFANLEMSKLIDMRGTWQFAEETSGGGKAAGWHKSDFDDRNWGKIEVPGMWGHTPEYRNVQIGWYRTKFEVNGDLFKKYPNLYLSAKALTDKADLYVNGKYLYTTKKWNELVQLNVTDALKPGINTIAIRIENHYFRDGMYFGGIRNFVRITDDVKDVSFETTSPAQLKRFLWNQVVHGFSGKNLWHTRVPCRGIPDHGEIYTPAMEALPYFKAELANVADIVMPRPRIKGRVAIYWPYETLLSFTKGWVKGGGNRLRNVDNYYGPLLLSGVPLDFADSQSVIQGRLDQYKILFFIDAVRLDPVVLPIVEAYVKRGGVVVMNGGSLQIDHDWYSPLKGTEFLGIEQLEEILKPYEITFNTLLEGTATATGPRKDEASGWRFNVADANRTQIIARQKDGKPAIVVTSHGKGKVYFLGANLDYLTMDSLLNKIIDSRSLKRDLNIMLEDKVNVYIESHLFQGQVKDKQVWHFTNWNGIGESFSVIPQVLPRSAVVLRDVSNGKFVKSPDGNNQWTPKELQGGVGLFAEASGTLILLVEKAGADLRKLEFLSPRHQKLVTNLFDHNVGGKRKAMYMFESGMTFIKSGGVNILLRSRDYEIHDQLSYHPDYPIWDGKSKRLASLEDYRIVIFVAPFLGGDIRNKKKFAHVESDLLDYVAKGGNLLLCGRPSGFATCRPGTMNIGDFDHRFNVSMGSGGMNGKEYFFGDPMYVIVRQMADHALMRGVESFYCSALSSAKILNNPNPLVKSIEPLMMTDFRSGSREFNDTVVAAAIKYGKGKVVVVSGSRWMESQELKRGDNAQFMLNILSWFENKPPQVMDKEKLHEIVDLSF